MSEPTLGSDGLGFCSRCCPAAFEPIDTDKPLTNVALSLNEEEAQELIGSSPWLRHRPREG